VKTGVLIGVLCAAWTYVMGFTGWFKTRRCRRRSSSFLIEVTLLLWGLRQTRTPTRTGRQVMRHDDGP